jgi:predicted metal-dependent hydrolase
MRLLPVGGNLVEVHVRESARARVARIVVERGHPPEIVVPPGTSERTIRALLDEHEDWLARQVIHPLNPRLGLDQVRIRERDARRKIRALVHKLASAEAPKLQVSYARITIRDQRTRWGSCSSTGTLSFSWRLALAPLDVVDYVVVHELCHLVELNHSRRFWRILERARPGYRDQRAWLDEHGWELHAYKPAHA